MRILVGTYTNQGTRSLNEDYVSFLEKDGALIIAVADGLGGHDKGEVASEHVATYITNRFQFDESPGDELARVIRCAQNSLLELQKKEKAVDAMKTTIVALAIKETSACYVHVGDSRCYAFQKQKLYARTLDHSVPQMLALTGEIKEKEIRKHPDRSSLLRVMGTVWERDAFEVGNEIDTRVIRAFLLCSDGFWELITEKHMMKCLRKSKTPDEWLEKMVKIIEKNGKGKEMDNYTAGAVFVMEDENG